MKYLFHGLSLVALALALTSCPNSGTGSSGAVGPYDAQGNYVEAWADDPSKWRYPARGVGDNAVAKGDLPPADVTPLPPSGGKPEILLPGSSSKPTQPDRTIASNTTKPRTTTTTRPTTTRSSGTPSSRSTTSKPKPTVAKTTTKPKPKPKPTVAKTTRHTIKKGDTLSGLASKYGTSVAAIQKANNLSGTMIREGKSLVIPRKK
ncbi:MAG: LysM peptidoglycan-binding domain-containing protein [Verrucomicrobia bacterium]|nr:LysM peptidoglycan-binding domain-containing protein [Verrucomicrobiota bacterium]